MMIFLSLLFYCSVIFTSDSQKKLALGKIILGLKGGDYHEAYKAQVFNTAGLFSTIPAWLYCKEKSQKHEYEYPFHASRHLTGYTVTGYERNQENVDFSLFKESFERYCYLPCDGLSLFYNQYPLLKKTLSYFHF